MDKQSLITKWQQESTPAHGHISPQVYNLLVLLSYFDAIFLCYFPNAFYLCFPCISVGYDEPINHTTDVSLDTNPLITT